MQEKGSDRFAGLDLLRGIAALAVLLIHSWSIPFWSWQPAFLNPFPRAYLAVDLFFVLSGFVIAHAYWQRLGTAAQLKQYCLARLIRLYPLYCIATLLSAGEMLAAVLFGHDTRPPVTLGNLLKSLGTGVFFLPTPGVWSVSPELLFPLAFTAWSLLWELLVNLLFGIVAPRLRGPLLAAPILFGGIGVCLAAYSYHRVDLGGFWHGAWIGGPRALFSFFTGVAIFRLRQRYQAPAVPALLPATLLLASMIPGTFGGGVYDLACILLLFPLLVWFGAEAAMGPRLRAVASFAGYLSYPVYLLQAPFLWAFAPASVRLAGVLPTRAIREAAVQIYPLIVIAASWLIARWLDSPIREWLRARYPRRQPKLAAQSAP